MKAKVIELKDCFLKAVINSDGWVMIADDEGNEISLGHYPNKRFDIIRKAIEHSAKGHSSNYKVADHELNDDKNIEGVA